MKSILWKSILVCVCMVALAGLLPAQTLTTDSAGGISNFVRFNPPPCDFNDTFYKENGVELGFTEDVSNDYRQVLLHHPRSGRGWR